MLIMEWIFQGEAIARSAAKSMDVTGFTKAKGCARFIYRGLSQG